MKALILIFTLLLYSFFAYSQITKISTLTLTDFSKKQDEVMFFRAKNNKFYFSTRKKIYTLNSLGEIQDSLVTDNEDIFFEVLKDSLGQDFFCSYNQSIITIYKDKKMFKQINLYKLRFFPSHFYADDKSIYLVRPGIFDSADFNIDYIDKIDINNYTRTTHKLPSANYESFIANDSAYIFSIFNKDGNSLFFLSQDQSIKDRKVEFKNRKDLKYYFTTYKIIGASDKNCLFVSKDKFTKTDSIKIIDLKTLRVKNLLNLSRPAIISKKPAGVVYTDQTFLIDEYPNSYIYSLDNNKLFVYHSIGGVRYIDTYKLDNQW